MSGLRLGSIVTIADMPGRWAVWSHASGHGLWFLVPADAAARGTRFKWIEVRAMFPKGAAVPSLKMVHAA